MHVNNERNRIISNNNNSKLRILHQNIQHLASKLDIVNIILTELRPDIVVFTEHNMRSSEIERLNIEGFNVHSFYARDKMRGGGSFNLSQAKSKSKENNNTFNKESYY